MKAGAVKHQPQTPGYGPRTPDEQWRHQKNELLLLPECRFPPTHSFATFPPLLCLFSDGALAREETKKLPPLSLHPPSAIPERSSPILAQKT